MTAIDEFVAIMQGVNARPIYRTYTRYSGSNHDVMKTISCDQIETENQQRCIYYIPSLGGTKNSQIHTMTSCYADLDCGRPSKGEYHSVEVVAEYKNEMLRRLDAFPLKPSIIVETRNGFHAYWCLQRPVHDQHIWREVQGKIATHFEGDYAVCSPHQPMRLPFTWWRKKKEGLQPFYVSVVRNEDVRYRCEELQEILADVVIPARKLGRVYGRLWYEQHMGKGGRTKAVERVGERPPITLDGDNRNIEAIMNGDVEHLQSVLNPSPRTFSTHQEFYEYLTQEVSLEDFLGVYGRTCQCPFHEDGTPSAGFFLTDRGEHFFHCFGCGTRGNIRGLVQHIRGGSYHEAMAFLKQVYRITVVESEWQKERRLELEEVKGVIDTDVEHYSHLHQNVRDDLMLLRLLVDIAIDNIRDEEYTDSQGRMIFWTSLRYLGRRYGLKHHKTMGTKIVSLALHKLLDRIHHDDVPSFLREKSERCRARHCDGKMGKKVSYYSIPSLSVGSLIEADDIARTIQESGLGRQGYSYEGICRTFSTELADAVYVQRGFSGLSDAVNERTMLMHEITMDMIEHRGWATEIEIQEQLEARYRRTMSKLTIKRALPEMLQSYGLEQVWWTKELRERFEVKEKTSGKIIVQSRYHDSVQNVE